LRLRRVRAWQDGRASESVACCLRRALRTGRSSASGALLIREHYSAKEGGRVGPATPTTSSEKTVFTRMEAIVSVATGLPSPRNGRPPRSVESPQNSGLVPTGKASAGGSH
jgi:hypothetical protein